MAHSLDSVEDAVLASLKESGMYDRLCASVRAEIYKMLTENESGKQKAPLCRENYVINELIREYLRFNNYNDTLSVFVRETSQPKETLDREFVAHALGITPHPRIPLLYTMTSKTPDDIRPAHPPPVNSCRPEPKPSPIEFSDDSFSDDGMMFEIGS